MKKFSITTIIIGFLFAVIGTMPLYIPKMLPNFGKSIGIIGGAESEITKQVINQLRYNLWHSSFYYIFLIIGIVIIILGIVLSIISNFKKK